MRTKDITTVDEQIWSRDYSKKDLIQPIGCDKSVGGCWYRFKRGLIQPAGFGEASLSLDFG